MRKPYQSIRVFQDPRLEKLTHVHPITPLLLWGPIVVFLYYYSVATLGLGPLSLALISLAGIIVWTLAEYFLHRTVFHFIGESELSKRLHFLIHGLHHDDPNDPTRLVMPPAGSLILSIPIFLMIKIFFTLIGAPVLTVPFFASFLIGYLAYDYTHYATHHFIPRSKFGKMVKQHHMRHHFVDPDNAWGVSSPLWDHVFGTMPVTKKPSSKRPPAPDAQMNHQPTV